MASISTQWTVADLLDQFGPIPVTRVRLAVEIISKGNTREEIDRKLREYFQAKVRLVWYVYPDRRSVRVFTSANEVTELSNDQSLDGGDVLPGFTPGLSRLFEEPRKRT